MQGLSTQIEPIPGRWWRLAGVWALYMAFGLNMAGLAPLVPDIEADLGFSHASMGTVLGAWQFIYIFAAIPCGLVLDRMGTRRALFWGALLIGASGIARGFAQEYSHLLAAVALFGLGGPLISAGAPKVVSENFTGAERGLAMGIYITGPGVGAMVSLLFSQPVLMPLLGGRWGLTPQKKKGRFELNKNHKYFKGINEEFSIDNCIHSFFGVSKSYADLLVQEYGKNTGLKTVCFRAGCITGPNHSGAKLHGFLSFLVKQSMLYKKYSIIGYNGNQVRDNIHSFDLVNCFWEFYKKPSKGEVYNIGGGRKSNCSINEIIKIIEFKTKNKIKKQFIKKNRVGDHKWYITDNSKFHTINSLNLFIFFFKNSGKLLSISIL